MNNYFDDFKDWVECIENGNKNTCSKSNKIYQIIDIAKEEFAENEIKEALLKQCYKVEEIYLLFVDSVIQAIENEEIEKLKGIVGLFDDKNKVDQLLDEIWEQKDRFQKDINRLIKFYKALKEINKYNLFRQKIISSLRKNIEDIESLSKLEVYNIKDSIEILDSSNELKNLFIEKSAEIITTIPEDENNEEQR
ncbi:MULTISPECIES: hypothetical protein [unclassified Nitratiruptor]|uniref:hypothetical protein n=1 Tax=unclassified Nitratiruptor TaxID=2624044 RepID=UPI0019165D25|nr:MULTISPECIES: hypothetical protein [unclassified Nitratiruptor]BCD60391.1 hypothetical protein NitYY0810_C1156 [Nitratiruptor sp. YY08-10]BCD64120.1 hypothetical protein NitYY0814_C0965 [Nitratiruptor sp. YY08-14]